MARYIDCNIPLVAVKFLCWLAGRCNHRKNFVPMDPSNRKMTGIKQILLWMDNGLVIRRCLDFDEILHRSEAHSVYNLLFIFNNTHIGTASQNYMKFCGDIPGVPKSD